MQKKELEQKVSELFDGCMITHPTEDEIIVTGGGLPEDCSVKDKRTEGISVSFFNTYLKRQQELKYIYSWADAYELLYMGLTRPDRLADYDGTNINTLLGREPYDFKWQPEGDIIDIDDHTLKNVIAVVKQGFVLNLFYDEGEIIVEGYNSVYEADLKSRASWRRMVVNLLRKEQGNANGELIKTDSCHFDPEDALFEAAGTPEDAGPDRDSLFGICGYLEYAYRNGDLPDLLAERDRIRKDYRVPNGPYAFTWDVLDVDTAIPESVYQLAKQICKAGLVYVEKELNSHNCVTITVPDFNASAEEMTGSQEQTFSALAATVEEWNTKEGKKKHKNDPCKTYRTPIGDPLFKCDVNTDTVYDSIYIISGYLQYLKDCDGNFDHMDAIRAFCDWDYPHLLDQVWGEEAMHISLRTDMFGNVTDQDLELADCLQGQDYVSLYPNVVFVEEENKIYYAVWASEAVVNWSGDKGQLLAAVKGDKIKHAPVVRLLMTDEFDQEQSDQTSENIRHIVALAAYMDYLHKTDQYHQYLICRNQSALLKEYPFLSRKDALVDPESDQSLYCIIKGGNDDTRKRTINEIAEILYQQGKIHVPEPTEYTFSELAQTLYGDDIVRLRDYDTDKASAAFENPGVLQNGLLYVLTEPESCDPGAIGYNKNSCGWQSKVLDYLQNYQPDFYFIVIIRSGFYSEEDFINLRREFSFLFEDAVIVIEREDPEILYQEFTKQLDGEISKKLPDTEFEKYFVKYVRDNRRDFNLSDQELIQFLVTYVNYEGRLVLPENLPYIQSDMKKDMIGKGKGSIWNVMDQLRAYSDFLKEAERENMDIPPYYWNMIFVGNPGTGKTLMAQYMTRLLWQYGVVGYRKADCIHFTDLQAKPGIINSKAFTDKGIAIVIEDVCNDGDERDFVPALEQIAIHMDDFKGEQVIILTGTPEGIEEARKACAKLFSRVSHIFEFKDYSTAEMAQLFFIKMKDSGFGYIETEKTALNDKIQDLCDRFGHRRNTGNGRFVDRLVDQTIMNYAQRKPEEGPDRKFTVRDIPMASDLGLESVPKDYKQTLNQFIGMPNVKKKVNEIAAYVEQQKKIQKLAAKSKKNIKMHPTCMHMVFEGNPGTGKTTIARVMADIFYSAGVLKTNHFTEVGREDLVGQYIGHTEQKTKAVIQEALDGVLLVDEAYTLVNYEGTSTKDFGREAIGVLLRAMEDYKDCLVIIFAGYTDEMRRFIDGNPGIASRIAYTIDFPDYTTEELTEMFRSKMIKDGYIIEKEQGENVLDKVRILCEYFSRRRNFGNGRFIDKLMQETRIRHANNMAKMDKDAKKSKGAKKTKGDKKTNDIEDSEVAVDPYEQAMTLSEDDIPSIQVMAGGAGEEEPEGRADNLDNIIGLEKVKEQFRNFEKVVNYQKEGRERGVTIPDFHMHMVFRGDPGTGKTIMARQVKDELYQIGIIKENKLVEVLGDDLIGLCVGGQKTKAEDQIEKAMGGVLFIDEAYSLAYGKGGELVEEAVATLVKAMEDHKDDLVIIFAGYAEEMDNFISMNPGLSSRIGFTFTFDNYSADELTEMFAKKMKRNGFIVSSKARENVTEVVEYFRALPGFGNGRFVDRLIQATITNRARRFSPEENPTTRVFKGIKGEDIPSVQDMGGRKLDVEEEEKLHKERVACHEAGHALVSKILEPDKELAEITIHRNAISYGYVASEEPHYSDMTETALKCQLAAYFGGRNAENLVYGDHDPGCQGDMIMALDLAQRMVNEYAMGIFGKTTPMDLLHEADRTATTVLENYKGELCQIQDFLLERGDEVISGEEFEKFYQEIHKEIKSVY